MNLFDYRRRETGEVQIGGTPLGGNHPIRVQSMTNTSTMDTEACVAQTLRIAEAGGDYVRLTTQGVREAENLRNINAGVRAAGCAVPLVADVHFNPKVADVAALYAEKVRINPGNYVDAARTFKHLEYTDEEYAQELKKIEERFVPFLRICRENHTAIRIGVNHGSLSDRIMSRYGDTPEGIVESCMEFLRICVKEDFKDVVVSIKASNTVVMVRSVRLLVDAMEREGMRFPLHLGVTEAGDGEDGRIKSAVGIGALHHWDIAAQRNEWSGHFELQYSRFFDKQKRISLDLKARAMLYQTNFDGITLKKNGESSTWFDANLGLSVGVTYYFKKRHWDRCLPCERPVYNIHKTVIMPANDCPEYGTMMFYVFFPNNYSGRNDAPTIANAPVNAIDYLASGIFTQTKFDDAATVASRLQANTSLSKLRTSDVATEKDGLSTYLAGINRGYEMSSSPISLSMNADSMNAFKAKTGYYYAPMYSGANTWYYRVDRETATQRLIDASNYKENQSFSLNAHAGLNLVKSNLSPEADADLFSFADVYGAIEHKEGNVAQAADAAAVNKLKEIFNQGRILYVVAEGLATSQDNFIGENAEDIGLERNKKLAYNRAYTVINWLKGNEQFKHLPSGTFAVNALIDPVINVDDASTRGLNSKLGRCVKVKIQYVIDKKK